MIGSSKIILSTPNRTKLDYDQAQDWATLTRCCGQTRVSVGLNIVYCVANLSKTFRLTQKWKTQTLGLGQNIRVFTFIIYY